MQAQTIPIVIVAAWLASPTAAFSQAVERAQDLKPFTTLDLQGLFRYDARCRVRRSASP